MSRHSNFNQHYFVQQYNSCPRKPCPDRVEKVEDLGWGCHDHLVFAQRLGNSDPIRTTLHFQRQFAVGFGPRYAGPPQRRCRSGLWTNMLHNPQNPERSFWKICFAYPNPDDRPQDEGGHQYLKRVKSICAGATLQIHRTLFLRNG